MNLLVPLATIVVVLGMTAMTVAGAHALTGNAYITAVLSALVVIQWSSARRAMDVLADRATAAAKRLVQTAGFAVLYAAAAIITVPFVGGELYAMFQADNAAQQSFEAEQRRLTTRASRLAAGYDDLANWLIQLNHHASRMATLEAMNGHTCSASQGSGTGDVYAFRSADAVATDGMAKLVQPQLQRGRTAIAGVNALQFTTSSAETLRMRLNQQVVALNQLAQAPVLQSIFDFVNERERATNIQVGDRTLTCRDDARAQFLAQLRTNVARLTTIHVLTPAQISDATDRRAIMQSTQLQTWAAVLSLLPHDWFKGGSILDHEQRQQGGSDALLAPANQPLVFAWLLEGILIALIFLSRRGKQTQRAARGWRSVLQAYLEQRALNAGGAARVMATLAQQARAPRPDVHPDEGLFPSPELVQRAECLRGAYQPWGRRHMLFVQATDLNTSRFARELCLAAPQLLREYEADLSAAEIVAANRQLGRRLRIVGGTDSAERIWDSFEILEPRLVRWLLRRPA